MAIGTAHADITSARIVRLSHAHPLGYFFLDAPPEEPMPIPFFRTVGDQIPDKGTADLIETVRIIQMRQEWMNAPLSSDQRLCGMSGPLR